MPTAEAETAPLLATLPDGRAPHLILGSDVCYSQGKQEMQMLVDTMAALAEPGRTTISRRVRGQGGLLLGHAESFLDRGGRGGARGGSDAGGGRARGREAAGGTGEA